MECTRCKKREFYFCKDGPDWISFCKENSCMKDDSDSSKSIAREEYAKGASRDARGNIISGADKFGMGARYKNASLAKWLADDKHHAIVNNWIYNLNYSILVEGSPGTGKTFMLASVLNYLDEKKLEIFYITQRKLIKFIQDGISEDQSQYYLLNKIAYKNILLFDDLGSSANTEWQKEIILELIDIRYSKKLPTIYTTNLNNQQIKDELGNRTASRLLSKENKIIEIWTEDLRQSIIET